MRKFVACLPLLLLFTVALPMFAQDGHDHSADSRPAARKASAADEALSMREELLLSPSQVARIESIKAHGAAGAGKRVEAENDAMCPLLRSELSAVSPNSGMPRRQALAHVLTKRQRHMLRRHMRAMRHQMEHQTIEPWVPADCPHEACGARHDREKAAGYNGGHARVPAPMAPRSPKTRH